MWSLCLNICDLPIRQWDKHKIIRLSLLPPARLFHANPLFLCTAVFPSISSPFSSQSFAFVPIVVSDSHSPLSCPLCNLPLSNFDISQIRPEKVHFCAQSGFDFLYEPRLLPGDHQWPKWSSHLFSRSRMFSSKPSYLLCMSHSIFVFRVKPAHSIQVTIVNSNFWKIEESGGIFVRNRRLLIIPHTLELAIPLNIEAL
jgi:hypothetical protein